MSVTDHVKNSADTICPRAGVTNAAVADAPRQKRPTTNSAATGGRQERKGRLQVVKQASRPK